MDFLKSINVVAAANALFGGKTTTSTPAPEVKRPDVVVHTGKEAKASHNLLYLHTKGIITLSAEDVDRYENVLIADEIRKSNNRENSRIRRHFANPANQQKDSHKVMYGVTAWHGKFGNDLPMNDFLRGKTYDENESRTPNEIKAAK